MGDSTKLIEEMGDVAHCLFFDEDGCGPHPAGDVSTIQAVVMPPITFSDDTNTDVRVGIRIKPNGGPYMTVDDAETLLESLTKAVERAKKLDGGGE